eukprot:CAMPEP_0194335164 /NCGR_PEP_ID=MMETSP0171-20130528/68583_1 /TAXON_ID=218684 /ORGANISM="Corethron pennatum, Strain L29A3" /LENGTH=869 /DNA_ID=CAMNT_0039098119 /DNA_START=33 /DNA_END=2639 /DNA_ORIENTATION=+
MGSNIQSYKRRFFVLKPTTHLYYFLSSSDTEPRGCIDLENSSATIRELEVMPDGRYRFEILYRDEYDDDAGNGALDDSLLDDFDPDSGSTRMYHRIVLEARNCEVGRQWVRSLTTERLGAAKGHIVSLVQKNTELEGKVAELEKIVNHMASVEKERDEALKMVVDCQQRHDNLNEGVRWLAKKLSRTPDEEAHLPPDIVESEGKDRTTAVVAATPLICNTSAHPCVNGPTSISPSLSGGTGRFSSSVPLSLDDFTAEDLYLRSLDLSRTAFPILQNAANRVVESCRLSSIEASSSVQEIQSAQDETRKVQKRLTKAEKMLCKFYEENCELRNLLEKKGREKKVLVAEVRKLLETSKKERAEMGVMADHPKGNDSGMWGRRKKEVLKEDEQAQKSVLGSGERKLIMELEEHVLSSLELHEGLMKVNTSQQRETKDQEKGKTAMKSSVEKVVPKKPEESLAAGTESTETDSNMSATLSLGRKDDAGLDTVRDDGASLSSWSSPIHPHRLFSGSHLSRGIDKRERHISSAVDSAASFVNGDNNDVEGINLDKIRKLGSSSNPNLANYEATQLDLIQRRFSENGSCIPNHNREFPLLKINLDDDDEGKSVEQPESTVSALTTSSGPLVTETAQATAVFSDAPPSDSNLIHDDRTDGKAYRLTFHSPRIGLQFQKFPAFSNRPRGALAEAMAADLPTDEAGNHSEGALDVVRPLDAVLVCGFEGFNESSGPCPKLGARLIAFDDVSIERGRWTFEAVSKAIKARGRPLSMTFRNDFLNSEQRSILNKSVLGVSQEVPGRPPPDPKALPHRLQDSLERPRNKSPSSSANGGTHSIIHNQYLSRRSAVSESGSVLSSAVAPLLTSLLGGLGKDTRN